MHLSRQHIPAYALLLLLLSWSNYTIAQDQDPLRLPLQKGHRLAVLEVRWSPNDKLLLTYSAADGFMNVWQMPEAKLVATMKDSTVRGTVTRLDLTNSSLLSTKTLDFCKAEARSPNSFAYSEDLSLAGVRCGYKTYVMDTASGSVLRETSTSTDFHSSIVFSRDKQFMAIGDSGSTKLLNLADGTEVVFDNELPIMCRRWCSVLTTGLLGPPASADGLSCGM